MNKFLIYLLTAFLTACLIPLSARGQTPGLPPGMPVYGDWISYTTTDGLPDDKIYCVRVDGERLWAGTKNGLAVLENGQWTTFGIEEGLAHPGVLSMDISEESGDVWIGTFGGLNRFSAGKFETFTQFNSGLPNDVIYSVACHGHEVWVATGGGAGRYDTYTGQWEIFTERNAPMHEPWTYGVCSGGEKVYIAAWGGGVIEYNTSTDMFRDYVDPDGEMELDLFPDDGLVHDITTGVSYANDILWVGTYFGLSMYDGSKWKGYFDHDSGLASNFINFLKARNNVVFLCTDKGLSSFDGRTWVSYRKDENKGSGLVLAYENKASHSFPSETSIVHNFVIGVDFHGEYIWLATSKGISRGEILNK